MLMPMAANCFHSHTTHPQLLSFETVLKVRVEYTWIWSNTGPRRVQHEISPRLLLWPWSKPHFHVT